MLAGLLRRIHIDPSLLLLLLLLHAPATPSIADDEAAARSTEYSQRENLIHFSQPAFGSDFN